MAAGQVITCILVDRLLQIDLPLTLLAVPPAVIAASNLWLARRNRRAAGDGRDLHVVAWIFVLDTLCLTGALVLTADLIREMPMRLSLRVVAVSSYPGTSITSKGAKIEGELPKDLSGKHVLIIDDILDSGQTIGLVKELIERQKPASLRTCVLLRKPESVRARHVDVEYVGFDIPNEFVVGYGLDFGGYYRNYPQIATLRPEAIEAGLGGGGGTHGDDRRGAQ